MEIDTPFAFPDMEIDNKDTGLLAFFINYLSVLEGIKTKTKNLHWGAEKLPNRDKRGAHLYLDDFLEVISDFQDTIAESCQGLLGSMGLDAVHGIHFPATGTSDFVDYIRSRTIEFYVNLPKSTEYVCIKSETETFIVNIDKYKYLFKLTE